MIVDTLENLEKYTSLNPLFAQAVEFLKSQYLQNLEIGKTELKGKDLFVNVAQTKPKTKEEAKLETHNDYIDIQIPLSGIEVMAIRLPKLASRRTHFITLRKISPSSKDWPRLMWKLSLACSLSSFHKMDMLPELLRME